MAMRVSVVPVSTMPAVLDRILVDAPKRIAWLMPQNSDAGDVRVSGLHAKSVRTPNACTRKEVTSSSG